MAPNPSAAMVPNPSAAMVPLPSAQARAEVARPTYGESIPGRRPGATRTVEPSPTRLDNEVRGNPACRDSKGLVGFSRYCWTRSTIGMMAGGRASSMPSSSMIGPR